MTNFPIFRATQRIVPAALAVAIVAFFFLPLQQAHAEEWQITYAVVREQWMKNPADPAAHKQEERSYTTTVTLGQEYLMVSDGHEKKVYDFTRRRMVQLHLDRHEYDDWSLFSNVGARIRELQNRATIHASMRMVKPDLQDAFGRFENETSLGLVLPGMKQDEPEPTIERKNLDGGGWDFWHNGVSVVQFVPATTGVSAAFGPRFASFLAHECSIHPKIRRELAVGGEIPQLLVTRWQNGDQQNIATYRLQSVVLLASNSAILPADFKPALHRGEAFEPLVRAVARARDDHGATHRSTRAEVEAFAKAAVAAKRPLDAYLALLEYRLQSGERHANDLRRYQREFDQDRRCQLYVASLDQSSKEACRKSLASIESIDRTGLQKAYMIDLQRADLLQILGRGNRGATMPGENNATATAEKLFLSVLDANPYLAGAYHDLGALYDEPFRSPMAWLCFDTGRQLSPDHFLFKDIDTFEQRIQRDFPDFF